MIMTIKLALGGLFLTALLVSTTAQAQQTAPRANAPTGMSQQMGRANRGNGNYQAADPATRARRMTDQLTSQLKLDDATSKKVYDLVLARDQQIDAIQTGTDDNRTKNTKLNANATDFKSKMQGVLTADQYQQFLSMKHRGRGDKNEQPATN